MKLYEVKALAHETQSRIRQDLNAWNDFLEHASRVYRYRFMDQILIYAQRPDAVACATMNIWNSKMGCWIKKGNRGIALIDESNSRKLKYVWDVASVVPKMGGHLPRLWIRKPYHTETIQNRLLKVYGLQPQTDKYDTKEPSIEHTMDYLVEYLPDNENSKVNACAARAYEIWKETAEDKSTQLIFCDASTPRSDGGFDVYHAIKDKLIAKGVPDKEIAFIHDANTKKQKAELFSKVRSGQVRFLLGSTAKMGAGTNVQTRLIALHHIDVPWRPSDIEQQEGRILRQGNRNERVKIFRYVTENTFDSYSWQLIENKQKFIGQIMTSKSPVRSCDDVDEAALSYAEVKALATGNPYIKEKMTLDTEVAKLKLLKANFKSQKYRLEDAINKEYPVRIAKLEEKIEGLRQDIITRGSGEILSDGFEIRINGVTYDDKKEGGAALIAAARESKTPERTMIGEYKGFKLYSRFDAFFNLYYIHMQGRCEHTIEMSSDPAGMITRLNNCMAGFEKRLSDVQDALDETRIELETAEKEVTKKFDKEDILSEKLKRLSFLNAQLDADRKETPQNAPQNTQAQRNDIKEKYINI